MNKLSIYILGGLLFALFAPSFGVAQMDLDAIKRSTVFIYQVQSLANDLVVKCVSTGTIVSADGLIVTNAHSVVPSQSCDGETLIVSMNVDLNEPPVPKYRAEIANADQGLDIAVLRITRELDGRTIAAGALPVLPFVAIGASADLDIDDNILVSGYRDIGNQAVTLARGTITAFISEPRGGTRAWFKTRAELPGTMSGGGAYDSLGQLIGIPTSAKYGRPVTEDSCRFIEDTTGDGLINSSDHCVPVGDFISTIRPIRLAQSLIRGAALDLRVQIHTVPTRLQLSSEPPTVSRLIFSPS
ncbi:MAG: serine protease, partial [Chloroflexi bacterium]|nr:serine protease [Chloroflexota bacterium]